MEDRMKLQERAARGADATARLTEKFTEEWLTGVKSDALNALAHAKPDELINVQADYNAAMRFYNALNALARKGEQAAQKLRSTQE